MKLAPASFALALVLLLSSTASGLLCPLTLTLRDLYIQSDAAVLARIGPSTNVEGDYWPISRTRLDVTRVVKGDVWQDAIFIEGCARPNCETEGKFILAFLTRNESRSGLFEIADFGKGAMILSRNDLLTFLRSLDDLLLIPHFDQEPDEMNEESRRLVSDWFVRLALDPATRFEGTLELTMYGGVEPTDRRWRISKRQFEALLDALLASDGLTWGDDELLELVRESVDRRLDAWLLERLRSWYKDDDAPFWTDELMDTFATRQGWKWGKALSDEYEKLSRVEGSPDAAQHVLEQFLAFVPDPSTTPLASCFDWRGKGCSTQLP